MQISCFNDVFHGQSRKLFVALYIIFLFYIILDTLSIIRKWGEQFK